MARAVEQRWERLLFCHWPYDPSVVRPLVPPVLDIDLWGGRAWVSLVPFHVVVSVRAGRQLRVRSFAELNVRTYVRHDGHPGVWFLRIEASSRGYAWLARTLFHAPFRPAAIEMEGESFRSASAWLRYRAAGPLLELSEGSLEWFLTERYSMYVQRRDGEIERTDMQHDRWCLRRAETQIAHAAVIGSVGLAIPEEPPLAFAADAVTASIRSTVRV